MAIKPLNSVAGFSVGETPSNIILANGDVTTTNITTTGIANLNAIGNVRISGGTSGQVIQTDGSGVLSFVTIDSAALNNGTSNIKVIQNGNITFSSAGNANIVVITGTGEIVNGTLSVTGNANVGNLGTTGLITATGNVTAGNLVTGGIVSAVGTVTGGYVYSSGQLSAAGNVTAANVVTSGVVSATGNANVANLGTGVVLASGNVTAANLISNANLTVNNFIITPGGTDLVLNPGTTVTRNYGNMDPYTGGYYLGGIVRWTGLRANSGDFATTLSAAGNANIGNIGTAGLITATGNITGGNLVTGGVVSATVRCV